MATQLRTAVIGAGKMGRLHSRIYSEMDQVELVAIVDQQIDRAEQLVGEYGGKAFSDPSEILDMVDAVTVAVPTEYHGRVAEPLLRRGIPVLVEKPLSFSLDEARHLTALARENNTTIQVGYSERFNPVVQAMRRIKLKPRFVESNRISPYTFRSTDVGVVMDMMIHDIDILLSMVKNPVNEIRAVGVNVLGEHEDIANVRIAFENGCVANLTASRLALKTERKVRVFSEDAYLSLDYLKKNGVAIRRTANIDTLDSLREQQSANEPIDLQSLDWTQLIHVEELDIDDREPLRLEQEAFVEAIHSGERPQVSAEDAIEAMELAETIIRVASEHEWEGRSPASFSSEHWSKGDSPSK